MSKPIRRPGVRKRDRVWTDRHYQAVMDYAADQPAISSKACDILQVLCDLAMTSPAGRRGRTPPILLAQIGRTCELSWVQTRHCLRVLELLGLVRFRCGLGPNTKNTVIFRDGLFRVANRAVARFARAELEARP